MKTVLSLIVLLAAYGSFSQSYNLDDVHWASEVVSCSQTYTGDDYAAVQVLGRPDVYETRPRASANCFLFGWREIEDDESYDEVSITVKIKDPIKANRVVIAENVNPGCITAVYLTLENGTEINAYNASTFPSEKGKRLLQFPIAMTKSAVIKVKVVGKPSSVSGWNGLDGIGIINSAEPVISMPKVANVGPSINSELPELAPKISSDGKTLYFSREAHEDNVGMYRLDDDQDIWVSELNSDNEWSEATNLGTPVNNGTYNWVLGVSPDGNTLILSGKYTEEGGPGGSGLSISHKTSNGWTKPKSIDVQDLNNEASTTDYFLSNDGSILLLAIESNDSEGRHDLYVSFKVNSHSFSKPIHMGGAINSPEYEYAPFLASDGKTLYFSSDGFGGEGDNDIFVSRRLDESWTKWSEPENLGPEINTPNFDSDFSIAAKGDVAYMVSYNDSYGRSDIIKVRLKEEDRPEPVVIVSGFIYDSETNQPIHAEVVYDELESGENVGIIESSKIDGSYKVVLPYGKVYGYHAQEEGYYPISENIDLNDVDMHQEIKRDLFMKSIKEGSVIRMNNIFFESGKSSLLITSYLELNRVLLLLRKERNLKIEISGHTDAVGEGTNNLKLSQDRAQSVVDYLIKSGIDGDRLVAKGYGEKQPVSTNDSETGRQMNRRVEFKILSNQ